MKIFISFVCILLAAASPLRAGSDTFIDYQNYNHGYCPVCNSYPCKCKKTPKPDEEIPEPSYEQAADSSEEAADSEETPPPPVKKEEKKAAKKEEKETSKKEGKDIPNTCPKPGACAPTPTCATNCGISLCWVGIVIGALAAAGAILVGSGNGSHN